MKQREANKTDNKVRVVFMPSGKRGHFPKGMSVLNAARNLGVDIDSVCGGRAICGRCQITIPEGDFAKHNIRSSSLNVSKISKAEKEFNKRIGLPTGNRLGCQATLKENVVIDVPISSQVHHQVIRKPHESHDIDINPIIRAYYVEVEQPDMHKGEGDLCRLLQALENEWGLQNLVCKLHVMQVLQTSLRESDWAVTVAVRKDSEIIAIWPGFKESLWGIAVDVGSTTIAGHLCDLKTGEVLASAGLMNPQIRYGEDLMSRVSYIMMNDKGELDLIRVVREAINDIIRDLIKKAGGHHTDIVEMTLVGNPIMHHLVLGINPVELGTAPFALAVDSSVEILASDVDLLIHPGGYIYALPCIAGHVGADASAVLLAEEPYNSNKVSLIVDVGTNAEILLGNSKHILAASSPTGPAFEGAQISSGQRAAPGAIERVRIDKKTLEPKFKVIGCDLWSDHPDFLSNIPKGGVTGICGSGIIEVVAELFLAGVVDQEGRIVSGDNKKSKRILKDGRTFSYLLYKGSQSIKITQNDIRAIQLAKAALYAGVKLLMKRLGVEKVDRIRLAGAFGSHIDVKYAMVLGLIPDCDIKNVSSAGNAAGTGARVTLLNRSSRNQIEDQVRKVEKIETAVADDFQQQFVDAMSIPHSKDSFHNLAKEIDLPPIQKKQKIVRKRNRKRSKNKE